MVVSACGEQAAAGHVDNPGGKTGSVGRPVPDLELTALGTSKAPVRLSSFKGKVILLDVWASWCAPCKEELPMLDDMAVRLRSKGVEVVGVSIDENRSDAEQFLRTRPHWTLRLAHDPDGKLPARLEPPKMPTSYIVDRRGVIREVNAGFERADAQRIEAHLLALASSP